MRNTKHCRRSLGLLRVQLRSTGQMPSSCDRNQNCSRSGPNLEEITQIAGNKIFCGLVLTSKKGHNSSARQEFRGCEEHQR